MAYCAQIDENNIVINVIMIEDFPESQMQEYIKNTLGISGKWVKASDNSNFRYNYPSLGYSWDETVYPDGAFIPPKIHEDMILDKNTYQWKFVE